MPDKEKENQKSASAAQKASTGSAAPALAIKESPALVRKGGPAAAGTKENPILAMFSEKKSDQRMGESDKSGKTDKSDKAELEEIRFGEKNPTEGEMLVWLDTYDDIFSDFDPRSFAQRELSDDFLKELGRRYMENTKGGIEVHFQIPAQAREPRLEATIKKRLRDHFAHELHDVKEQIRERKRLAVNYIAIGFGLLLADVLLNWWDPIGIGVKVASILITPAGWFAAWAGLEKMVDVPYKLEHLRSFYEKFSRCNYSFITYDRE